MQCEHETPIPQINIIAGERIGVIGSHHGKQGAGVLASQPPQIRFTWPTRSSHGGRANSVK